MPEPMGKTLKKVWKTMEESGIVMFQGTNYVPEDMSIEELTVLHEELRADSRETRRPLREKTPEENRTRGYLSRLRLLQAKFVRREVRKQEHKP